MRQANVVRPPVDAIDDNIGRTLQLIIQPARDQPADHGRGLALAM